MLVNLVGRDLQVWNGDMQRDLPSSVEQKADDAGNLNHLQDEMRMA